MGVRFHPEDMMGEIHILAVLPLLQRQGIGRCLIVHGYFFGSKEGLYRAVLVRASEPVLDLVLALKARFAALESDPGVVLTQAVDVYVDFLATHPNTRLLIEREARDGGHYISELQIFTDILSEALATLAVTIGENRLRANDARQFLVSLMALCWFPFSHDASFLRAMGVSVADPNFLSERKQHVVATLLGMLKQLTYKEQAR